MIVRAPFVFPSLGPTAFLFFFVPRSPSATPRHAIYGHAIGLSCGYGALWIFGLQHVPSAMTSSVTLPRVLAAALLVLQAIVINRHAGIDYPFWALRRLSETEQYSKRRAYIRECAPCKHAIGLHTCVRELFTCIPTLFTSIRGLLTSIRELFTSVRRVYTSLARTILWIAG